jgi:predicted dehydrogenase
MGALSAVGWGIWGAGAVAHDVASDFPLVADARLCAVGSRTLKHAQQFAARHRVPHRVQGLDDLLACPGVDVIYVATPHTCHAEDAIRCLEAGKAVLCEKPFTVNAAQAERIVAAARMHQRFCMEAMWTRFIPAVVAARQRVLNGELGAVRLIQGNFAYPAAFDASARLFDRALAGGALLDRGVYLVSLTQHLLGVPQSVHGSAVLGASGVDEHSTYHLAYADGALANLAASLRVQGSNDFCLFGERGSIRLAAPFYRSHRLESWAANPPPPSNGGATDRGAAGRMKEALRGSAALKQLRRRLHWLEQLRPRPAISAPFPGNGYQFELAEVTRCVQQGLLESPLMPLDESINVMQTMDTLRRQWGLTYPQE